MESPNFKTCSNSPFNTCLPPKDIVSSINTQEMIPIVSLYQDFKSVSELTWNIGRDKRYPYLKEHVYSYFIQVYNINTQKFCIL